MRAATDAASSTPPTRRWLGDAGMLAAGFALVAILRGEGPASLLDAGFSVAWWVAVLIVVRSDLDRFIIPDGASLAIAGLGLAHAAIEAWLTDASLAGIGAALAVAAGTSLAAFGLVLAVSRGYRMLRGHEGLGFGDVKLAGASAIWLAPADAALALEIAAVAGVVVLLAHRRVSDRADVALPFGAFLAPAAWLAFVAGPWLHDLAERLG